MPSALKEDDNFREARPVCALSVVIKRVIVPPSPAPPGAMSFISLKADSAFRIYEVAVVAQANIGVLKVAI